MPKLSASRLPDALAVRPLADLADVFQAAQGAQYHDRQRLADAVEVALVFPACFNLRKVIGYIAVFIHYPTLYHDMDVKIDFRADTCGGLDKIRAKRI